MRRALLPTLFAAALSAVHGQPTFEAASIKLNTSGKPGSGISTFPARIKVINSTLSFCVQVAWNVKEFQVSGGAGWTGNDRYDIDAVSAEPFKEGEYRTMLQALLSERFGLVIHRETRDKPGYALVVGKNGSKLPPPIEDPSVMFSRTPSGNRTLKATSLSLSRFAEALSTALGATVVDKTGIEGRYDVSFEWTPDASTPLVLKSGELAPPPPADAVPGPTIFTALQEKLGLKLESRKVPVEVIVIELANRPTGN
jgi:uncharacterized protein (TIGR03435 family)